MKTCTPIDQRTPEHFRNVRGLIFDIDDTLTRDGVLEAEAFASLWQLHRCGFKLVAVTGRPLGWVDVIVRQWPIDLGVGENGAGWVSHKSGQAPRRGYFHDDDARTLQRQRLEELKQQIAERYPDFQQTDDAWARACDLTYDVGEFAVHSDAKIASLMAFFQDQGAKTWLSSVHAHAAFGSWDKAQGVAAAIKDLWSIHIEREAKHWAFIGDSGNDAEAFAFFGEMSVGVANVREHLSKIETAPRWITQGDRGQGFAEFAQILLKSHVES